MASTRITSQMIMRKALPLLHAKLNLIGNSDRQYDNQFGEAGAHVDYGKIGPSLQIRHPIQPTYRRGWTQQVSDTVEQSTSLVVSQVGGVDMNFPDADLTLNIDDFTQRYIDPATTTMATNLESDFAIQMYKQIYFWVGTAGVTPTTQDSFMAAKTLLNRALCPQDDNRHAVIDSPTVRAMVDALKGQYNPQGVISELFRKGKVNNISGLQWWENEVLPVHTNGTMTGYASSVVNGAGQKTTGNLTGTINIRGFTAGATITAGSIFTMAGVYTVHPETKVAFGDQLQQFVVIPNTNTSDGSYTVASDGTVTFSINPGIVATGGMQNVGALPADGAALTWYGAASTAYVQDLVFHKNSFAFVSAALELPRGIDMAYRATMDNISMRFTRDWDQKSSSYNTRLDVLWGAACPRPQLAVRVTR